MVTAYEKRISGHGSAHGMHSVKVEAHRRYASISELKVLVFLNGGPQQGCEVVTLGTSLKINVFFRRVYVYSLRIGILI